MALEPNKILTLEENIALSYRINTGHNVKDCCLSSAVWSNECADFALVNMEVNFIERCHTTELDGDVLEFEKFLRH